MRHLLYHKIWYDRAFGGEWKTCQMESVFKLTSGQLMYVLYHENDGLQGTLSLYFHKLLSVFFYKILIFSTLSQSGIWLDSSRAGSPHSP